MRCETAEQSNRPNEHAQYIFYKYCENYLKNMVDTVNSPSPSYPTFFCDAQEPGVLHQPRDGGGGGGGEGAGRVRLHSHCAGTGSSLYSG